MAVLALLALPAPPLCRAATASATITGAGSGGTFNVRDYGAKGDGSSHDTAAVRAAATAVTQAGGGTLYFPASSATMTHTAASGATYLTGAFNVSSHTHVLIDSGVTVLSSNSEPGDFPLVVARTVWPQMGHGSDCDPGSESCRLMHQAFVFSWGAQNVSFGGGGTIDGSGKAWWDCAGDLKKAPCNGYGRPHLMMMANVTDVELDGITVQNSPDWTLHFSFVTNLHLDGVTVHNPGSDAPNSDGIDCDCVQNAVIENSAFSVGDDALCVKSGIDWFGREFGRPSRDIVFRNLTIGSGHGISIGSEMSGSVYNVTFENIDMSGTENGPRIKSQRGRGGVIRGVVYRNITAKNVHAMIDVTMNYHSGLDPTNASATPQLHDVYFDNVVFTYDDEYDGIGARSSGKNAGMFDGLPEMHISNVTLHDVDFNGGDAEWTTCDYIDGSVCTGSTNACPPCFKNMASGARV